ncbi:GAF domain-containing protein [Kineosporia sp. R_H_3]|uniref:GAF domain-containing sensor histidine kinase n=1 Tax=Kineosporia sp. R_H_3 TaxID=1961848 RepID=UPI001303FB3C|nr:GAF domain-containing protein [Kineosporia sp. R_H_3]
MGWSCRTTDRTTDWTPGLDAGRRLRGLVAANLAVTANLTLREVLSQIVESARDLLDSTYAALGVLGDDGRLAQFLHAGLDGDTAALLGELPRGHGILGLLIDDPRPLRLHDLGEHPASRGFPADHPPMRSFIGVPIRVRDEVFGNIYLTDKRGGGPFTAEDEDLLVALAANAAVAVDHARLHDETTRARRREQASTRITTALLSEAASDEVLRMVLAEGRLLVDADDVHLDRDADGGDVVVVRRHPGRAPFDAHEQETIDRFSEQVALALGRARARDDRERVRLVAEHHRIARDMHDHVIGRLVGAGMAVHGLGRFITDPDGHRRLAAHLDDLDAAVRDLRTLIYGLDEDPAVVWSLPARVAQVVEEAAAHLGFTPRVTFDVTVKPPVGSTVPEHLLGVLREALANVARHACAQGVEVGVTCGADRVDLTVADDGTGPPQQRRATTTSGGHGLTNMAERAAALGGAFSLCRNASGGATLHWTAPMDGGPG